MLRRLWVVFGLVFLISISAQAQSDEPKLQFFAGYSYMRLSTTPSLNLNGWDLSGKYNFKSLLGGTLGGVVDLDGHYGSVSGTHVGADNFLFGPEVSWSRPRFSPFAHILIGGGHVGAAGSTSTSFAAAIGFGIDSKIRHGLVWRIVQVDYLPTHFFSDYQSNARVSTGIVFHF